MSSSIDAITRAVVDVVRELPDSPLDRLVATLEGEPGSARDVTSTVANPRARDLVERLTRVARTSGISEATIAAMLRSARAMQSTDKRERVELVWTGPNAPSHSLYRTEQTLLEMIQSAARNLLIVTFAAYKVDAIRDGLRAALARGVHVDLVLEQAERDGGKVSFDPGPALGAATHDRLRVHVWPREQRPTSPEGKCGSLHAKCAVADDRVLLVSSANLTEFALELNMELGVRVEGGEIPRRVREHFDDLRRRGVLVDAGGLGGAR